MNYVAEHSFVLVRFDLTLKKLLQWLVSNHVPVTLPPGLSYGQQKRQGGLRRGNGKTKESQ